MSHDLIGGNSGRSLALALAAGSISLDGVLAAYLDAIDSKEATVRAFVHLDRAAFTAARATDGPLAGLPVGIKDIADVAGMPTRCGSPIYDDYRPRSDAPAVSMIRRAGGRIAGKTVTTEFATRHPGPTTNPRNAAHTPGGSSSGSAAGVAAGMFPFAIGSQTAGSVIRPASYCGIAALKPTFGFLPYAGLKATAWHLDTVGLFAAGVRDVAFFAEAITGQPLAVETATDWKPRFGIMPTRIWAQSTPEMDHAMASAARFAERGGATMRDIVAAPIFTDAFGAQLTIQDYEIARCLAYEFEHFEHLFSAVLLDTMRSGQAVAPERYRSALELRHAARQATTALFADVDVLLAPSAPGAAPRGLANTGSPDLNRVWTMLGVPCVNVPGLVDAVGMPMGIQVIAPIGADRLALSAAAWLEDRMRG